MEEQQKVLSPIVRRLLLAAALPCLWAWWVVRIAIPAGAVLAQPVLALLALIPAALTPLLFRPALPYLLPWGAGWKTGLVAAAAFFLGWRFDLSFDMLSTPLSIPLLRTLCHTGNALLFAAIVLLLSSACRELKGLGKVDLRQFLPLCAVVMAVTAIYIRTSKTVYVWDGSGYWLLARRLAQAPLTPALLREILLTTITQDYNSLLAFPISLLMRFLGGGRWVFTLGSSLFYVLPGVWAMCALGRERKWGGVLLFALFPMFLYTSLAGFVDVAACSLGLWAVVVWFSDRPALPRGLLTGALLVGSFLLRRYFFFFAASFGVAALTQKLLCDRGKWSDFLSLFSSCALCSLMFTYSFLLEKVLGSNYRDLYSAYAMGLRSDAMLFSRYFGLLLLLALLILAVRGLARGEARSRLVFCLTQLISCFLAFVLVQSHGQQHLLLYLPAFAALAASSVPFREWKTSPALLSGAIFLNCLVPKAQPASLGEIGSPALIPSFIFYGPQRADIDALLELADFIDSLSSAEPHTAAVMSSSSILNCETLINLRPSLGLEDPQCHTTIQYHGTVDKRDAFNWNTPSADYIVVGDPVQVHLGEENQQVMAILAHDVLEGSGPGAAYEPLPETFQLSGGVTVRIYRRTRPWSYEEYRSISDRLTARYPDHADLYALPVWMEEAHKAAEK